MGIEHVGRERYRDYYKYTCDLDGCNYEVEFDINNLPDDWQIIEVYENSVVVCTKYLCPNHHVDYA